MGGVRDKARGGERGKERQREGERERARETERQRQRDRERQDRVWDLGFRIQGLGFRDQDRVTSGQRRDQHRVQGVWCRV